MEEQVLSIEQMQELKDLGIDISKASMIWFPKLSLDENKRPFVSSHFIDINRICHDAYWSTYEGKNSCPTFTLQDILKRLPGSIEEDTIGRFDYELRIKKDGVAYESFDALDSNSEPYVFDDYYIDGEQCKTVLDCAFEMLKLLKMLKKL